MGLDSYLIAKRPINDVLNSGNESKSIVLTELFPELNDLIPHIGDSFVNSLNIKIGYWRSCWVIHDWFESQPDSSYITREQLLELRDYCLKAREMDTIHNVLHPKLIDYSIEVIDRGLALPICWTFCYEGSK